MLIFTLRTDKPISELSLYDDYNELTRLSWEAHRKLAETVHTKIEELLSKENVNLKDIEGIVIYKGPGSFTGLRIGFSVANALADSLDCPITISKTGQEWQKQGIAKLLAGKNEKIALPDYGAPAKVTTQKK